MDELSFHSAERFLIAAKLFWTTKLYGRLREEYALRCETLQKPPESVPGVAEVLEDLTVYRYFAWLERHLQRMKYTGRYGLVKYYEERQEEVIGKLTAIGVEDSLLELASDFNLPTYYTAMDIHQHPGGVWSDEYAGLVYEHGARTTTPIIRERHGDLHRRFSARVAEQGVARRVLDMGCGFGKSTLPFGACFPEAQVEAIDLSQPCLRVAARRAFSKSIENVRFRQMNAEKTDYGNGSFDLLTSTMLLHELPPEVIERVFEESFRLLQPGGRMVHLDFWHIPDAFARFLHYGHGQRNNEPYMQSLAELDLPKLLRSKGFDNVEITPFEEADDLATGRSDVWRFPWSFISATKRRADCG